MKLVIEVDGLYHDSMHQKLSDLDRTNDIFTSEVNEIRFTNNQVETDIEYVIEEMVKIIQTFKDKGILDLPPTPKGENR